jgi:hypothetical protein
LVRGKTRSTWACDSPIEIHSPDPFIFVLHR